MHMLATDGKDGPANRPKVIFAGKTGGLLNVKYAFLQAVAADYGFDPLLAADPGDDHKPLREAGLPVLARCTPAAVADAAAIVLDDFVDNTALKQLPLPRVPVIQLWHGVPLKKIGFPEISSAVNMTPEKAAWLTRRYSGYASVPSTSPWMTEQLFSRVFRADAFPELGFARNDVLLRAPGRHDMLGVDVDLYAHVARHRKAGGKVVVYMPTFRDTGGSFLEDGVIDPLVVNAFCARHDILFLAKFHHSIRVDSFRKLPGFCVYNSGCDIYPLLPMADALITDYSSIYFDFMLLDKPLVFFPYDKEKYISRDRELFCDYASMTPGLHVRSQEELVSAILRTVAHGDDQHAEARRGLRDTVFARVDALSAHRVCNHIKDLVTSNKEC